ncbi:hypothetical protein MCEMSEM18_00684 [Comamonadaceae bacterium]
MGQTLYVWLLCACLLFWLMGVHNRLMRLRARALAILSALEKQVLSGILPLQHRLVASPADTSNNASDEYRAEWLQALRLMEEVWTASRKDRLDIDAQRQRTESWAKLMTAWSAWVSAPPDLAGPCVPDSFRLEWEASTAKAIVISDALNAILKDYNEGVSEPPACWVAHYFGFKVSALIGIK